VKVQAKTERFTLRATNAQRELIARAAAIRRTNATDFILTNACKAAEDALLDQRLFFADEETFSKFEKILERPVTSKPELTELMRNKTPWEHL
jgi:uncharacterized protein (DUF1778 family)